MPAFKPSRSRVALQCTAPALRSPSLPHARREPTRPSRCGSSFLPAGRRRRRVTRKIAQKLTEQTGQTFFVENKAGATGTIGARQAAKAAPDGYTLVANDTTYSLLPHIFKKLPFDHEQRPGAGGRVRVRADGGGRQDANRKYKTLSDLIAAAKAEPGQGRRTEPAAPGPRRTSRARRWRSPAASTSCTFRSRARARRRWPCCRADRLPDRLDARRDRAASRAARRACSPSAATSAWRRCPTCRPSPRPASRTTASSTSPACGRRRARPRR